MFFITKVRARHLGELMQVIPLGLVEGVLADTRATQRRLRALPFAPRYWA